MSDVVIEKDLKLDLLDVGAPALSATSDMPVIETKPDAQAKPEVKVDTKPDTKPAAEEPKAEEIAAPDEGKKPEESATPEEPEDDPAASAAPKPAKGVQKRIDELVRQREDAERRAESEKQEKLRLLALVERGGKVEEKPATDEDPEPHRPDRNAFADIAAYENALADYADSKAGWSARHAVKDALAAEAKKTEDRQIAEGQRLAREAYAQRIEKASEKYPDYKAVAESPDVMVSVPMAHAILNSEHGPDLQYHLGKHPEEAKRISLLSPPLQLMEMGLIVARLTAPAAKEVTPAPQKPAVSAAPKPLKPLESKSEAVSKNPQDMSMDEYAEYVKQRDRPQRAGART